PLPSLSQPSLPQPSLPSSSSSSSPSSPSLPSPSSSSPSSPSLPSPSSPSSPSLPSPSSSSASSPSLPSPSSSSPSSPSLPSPSPSSSSPSSPSLPSPSSPSPSSPSSPSPRNGSGNLVYSGAGLVLGLLLLGLLLFIFFKQRRDRDKSLLTSTRPVRTLVPGSTTANQDPDTGIITNPTYSTETNQNLDTHDKITDHATSTNQHSEDIYSLINDTANIPRDPSCLHYADVSFSKDSDVRNQLDSVIYSSVRIQHSNHEMVTYSAIKPKSSH
uniref:Uncharacterized protein n=1 Tax=Esox lucius TaxID=8010 RepID=A0AAY5KVH7_ESOLU